MRVHSIVSSSSLFFLVFFSFSFFTFRNILWCLLLSTSKKTQNIIKLSALTQQVGAQIVWSTRSSIKAIAIEILIFPHLLPDQTPHTEKNVWLIIFIFLFFVICVDKCGNWECARLCVCVCTGIGTQMSDRHRLNR